MKLRMFPPTSTMGQTSQTTSFCPAISFLVPLLTSNQGMRDSDACSACQSHGNPSWHSRFLPTPSDSGWCSLFKHFEVYRCSSLGSVKLGPVIGGIELTTQARLQEKVQRLGPIVGLLCRFGSLAGNVITPTSLTEDVWKHLFANLRKSKRLEIHSPLHSILTGPLKILKSIESPHSKNPIRAMKQTATHVPPVLSQSLVMNEEFVIIRIFFSFITLSCMPVFTM